MKDEIVEQLLQDGLVQAPSEFRDQVMDRVAVYERQRNGVAASIVESSVSPASSKMSIWRWFVLLAGSVIGIVQLCAFVFGVWLTMSAG